MKGLVEKISLSLERPTPTDKQADRERLVGALIGHTGIDIPVVIDLTVLKDVPRVLRDHGFSVTVTSCFTGDALRVIALDKEVSCGVAVDIGTTNIVASLYDLADGRRIVQRERENPQTAIALDVLSRVQVAMGGRSRELHALLMEGMNALIGDLCAAGGIRPGDIDCVVCAGNTIMTHFLLDLPVENIPLEPYIPAAHHVDPFLPGEIGLSMNSRGLVHVFPNVGSYVGGDIVAGILSSGLYRDQEPSFLIDVGTNAEIVLGCNEWIIVGAGAAGPALEGGIAEIGMRATEGAVDHVRISEEGRHVFVSTIGNGEPKGICGSGMIELVSELYKTGVINEQGKFTASAPRLVHDEFYKGFIVSDTGDRQLIIKDRDIDNFLRSKAAMFSALYVIVSSVGLRFKDISQVYVSGAFGTGIDAEKAMRIGMIPRIGKEKIIPVGNTSLRGAEMLLMDRELLKDVDRICRMVTYREMNTDGDFMREFPSALIIPHFDPVKLEG